MEEAAFIKSMNLAETIKKITRDHLINSNGLVLGQCLTAVGWVGGTVPELSEKEGIVELSMADVAGGGIAVGYALAGRRPIYIVRYQGFQWYNSIHIANYAAKSKEMWGTPCPIFVRSIGMDGAIGPVASGSHHSIFTRMPGIIVAAPMTPKEYELVWQYFIAHDDPVIASEHRRGFSVDYEMEDEIHPSAEITFFAISSTRLNVQEAVVNLKKEGIICNIIHILWLKPFIVTKKMITTLQESRHGGIVLDGDFENGVAKCIAFDIMQKCDKRIRVLALEERTAGFALSKDNLPPYSKKIAEYVHTILGAS